MSEKHTRSLSMQVETPTAEPAGQTERRLGCAMARQLQGFASYALLEQACHFGRSAKIAVGRHQPVDARMNSLEALPVDELADPTAGVGQVEKEYRREALMPATSPEPLNLSHGLRKGEP
jgi:hypothetical protein